MADPKDKAAPTTPAPTHVYVRAAQGEFLHLFTNTRFGAEAKKAPLDTFLQAQIDAGKLIVETD